MKVTAMSQILPNTAIGFKYRKDTEVEEDFERAVVVTETTPTLIKGRDLARGGRFRNFKRKNIQGKITIFGVINES